MVSVSHAADADDQLICEFCGFVIDEIDKQRLALNDERSRPRSSHCSRWTCDSDEMLRVAVTSLLAPTDVTGPEPGLCRGVP